ncbi:hypothetical protein BKA81DRAFT_374340 [Phyllosticta paracitricarpa]
MTDSPLPGCRIGSFRGLSLLARLISRLPSHSARPRLSVRSTTRDDSNTDMEHQ